MLHQVAQAGLEGRIVIDSAGTGDWHVGEAPDARARRHGARRGYDLAPLRARQIEPADFERFDLVLAMDDANLRDLHRLCPPAFQSKVRLLMEYAPEGAVTGHRRPLYGWRRGLRPSA